MTTTCDRCGQVYENCRFCGRAIYASADKAIGWVHVEKGAWLSCPVSKPAPAEKASAMVGATG